MEESKETEVLSVLKTIETIASANVDTLRCVL